jgi:hypothetical protein
MSWWQAGSERSNINAAHHEFRRNAVHRAPSYSTPVIKAHGDPLHRQHFRTTFSKLKTDRTVSDDFHSQQRTVDRVLSRSVPLLVVIITNTNREDPIILHLIPFKTNTSRSNSEPERGSSAAPLMSSCRAFKAKDRIPILHKSSPSWRSHNNQPGGARGFLLLSMNALLSVLNRHLSFSCSSA